MDDEADEYDGVDEGEEQEKKDLIAQLFQRLRQDRAIDQAGYEALDTEVKAEVEDAVKFADESPDPAPDELTTHVLAD